MRVGSDDPLFMPNYWGQITWKKNYLCGESPFQPLGYNFVRGRNYVNTHTETLVVIIKRYWQISVVSGKSGIFA